GEMAMWLRTLARNVIRGVLAQRRRDAPREASSDRIDETLLAALARIDSQPLPQAIVERQETRELVGITLASLPPHYQEVLEARYLRGQPLEAIAREKTTTLDGVKSMLRRARAAFRDCFLALAKDE